MYNLCAWNLESVNSDLIYAFQFQLFLTNKKKNILMVTKSLTLILIYSCFDKYENKL